MKKILFFSLIISITLVSSQSAFAGYGGRGGGRATPTPKPVAAAPVTTTEVVRTVTNATSPVTAATPAPIYTTPTDRVAAAKLINPTLATRLAAPGLATAIATKPGLGLMIKIAETKSLPEGFQFTRQLAPGMTNSMVRLLQLALINSKYLDLSTPTDFYGTMTVGAVMKLQKDLGYPIQPGNFGPKTLMDLNTLLAISNATTPAATAPATPAPTSATSTSFTFTKYLALGARLSPDVKNMQMVLEAAGYLDMGGADYGYAGVATTNAIAKLQAEKGLEITRALGPLTRDALNKIIIQMGLMF